MQTVRLIIKGKVQGVFYRASAKDAAEKMYISGWVRNLPNDSVEIVASAMPDQLYKFIEWCHAGPPRAEVEEVIVEQLEIEEFTGFRIVR